MSHWFNMSCSCKEITDPCKYFKPPDPPPNTNSVHVKAFLNQHEGWKKYKEECKPFTATESNTGTGLGETKVPHENDHFLMTGTGLGETKVPHENDHFLMTGTGLGETKVPHENGLPSGAIIGIAISVMAFLLIAIIVVIYLVTQPKKRQKLWIRIKSKSIFECKKKISTCEVTLQNYEEVNFLHNKAVKGECYRNEAFTVSEGSEANIGSNTYTEVNKTYIDSSCNQNHLGSNQLASSSNNRNQDSPANHLPGSNIPHSKGCLTVAEINSEIRQLPFDKAQDHITGPSETRDTSPVKKLRKKKNHLKRCSDNVKSDLGDKVESLEKEKNKTL